MAKVPRRAAVDVEQVLAKGGSRNACHELLLGAIGKWEAEHGAPPVAVVMHPLTLETLRAEPKAREWNQGTTAAPRFYGLVVHVRAYEGLPYQLLSADEAAGFGGTPDHP
jgi:hypothetical protein